MGYARHDQGIHRGYADASSAGDNLVIPAQGVGMKIRVVYVIVIAAIANTITFKSGSTAISSAKGVAAQGGFILPRDENGWYETEPNEALNVSLAAAGAVGIDVGYVVVT